MAETAIDSTAGVLDPAIRVGATITPTIVDSTASILELPTRVEVEVIGDDADIIQPAVHHGASVSLAFINVKKEGGMGTPRVEGWDSLIYPPRRVEFIDGSGNTFLAVVVNIDDANHLFIRLSDPNAASVPVSLDGRGLPKYGYGGATTNCWREVSDWATAGYADPQCGPYD